MIQRTFVLPLALALAGVGCAKDESRPAEPSASPSSESAKAAGEMKTSASESASVAAPSEAKLAAEVGVEAGGIARQQSESAATIAKAEGTVEVRRLGEETWAPAA